MTRLRHFDNLGTARFVTFSCYRRMPSLTQPGVNEIFIEELDRARKKYGFQIYGYVLMPEHMHLVLYPPAGMKMGLVIGEIKSLSAKRYFSSVPHSSAVGTIPNATVSHSSAVGNTATRVFWQRRCYDHNCRTPEAVWEKIHYCHLNPVKRGLVSEPSAWRWSSYNWYQGQVDVPLVLDRMNPKI